MRYKLRICLVDAEEEFELESPKAVSECLRRYRHNADVCASEWLGAELYENGVLVSRHAYNGAVLK